MNCRLSNIWGWEPTSPNVSESIVAPAKERSVVCEQLRLALVGAQQGWGGCRSPAASPDQLCPPDNQPDPKNAQQLFNLFPKGFLSSIGEAVNFYWVCKSAFLCRRGIQCLLACLGCPNCAQLHTQQQPPPKMGQNWQLSSLKEDFEITTLGRFLTLNRLIKIVLAN